MSNQNFTTDGEEITKLPIAVAEAKSYEEDILIAEIEELEKSDASETYPRRLNAKEVLTT